MLRVELRAVLLSGSLRLGLGLAPGVSVTTDMWDPFPPRSERAARKNLGGSNSRTVTVVPCDADALLVVALGKPPSHTTYLLGCKRVRFRPEADALHEHLLHEGSDLAWQP